MTEKRSKCEIKFVIRCFEIVLILTFIRKTIKHFDKCAFNLDSNIRSNVDFEFNKTIY